MRIQVDYENVRNRAMDISHVISVLGVQKVTLQKMQENMHSVWEGDAANEFKKKLNELETEVYNIKKDMSSLQRDILAIAENLRKTDEDLAEQVAGGRGQSTNRGSFIAGGGSVGGGSGGGGGGAW